MPFVLAVAGALLTLSLPPYGWWPLGIALLIPFLITARAKHRRAAFRAGFWFGLPFFSVHLLWLPQSFAKLLSPAFWLIYPPLVLILASFWGLTTLASYWVASGFRNRQPAPGAVLAVLPFAWVLTEQLRTMGYFGFPWGALGYAWLDTPVGQLAEFGGVPLLSLITAGSVSLIGWAIVRQRLVWLTAPAALLAVAFVAGNATMTAEQRRIAADSVERTALLIQGNIDPYSRAITAWAEMSAHTTLSAEALAQYPDADLVIWPEGALSGHYVDGARGAGVRAEITAGTDATFFVGGRHYLQHGSHNSTFSFSATHNYGRYDKKQLVPFGEQWPLYEQLQGVYSGVFRLLNLPLLGATLPGTGVDPLPTHIGAAAAFICYESVFPAIVRALVNNGGKYLVLTTNDAWFAMGNGAEQHFDMGRMRAIETRRWLLRAGNDGITAAVNTLGKTTEQLERGVADWLPVTFYERATETIWVRYGGYGTPIFALIVLIFGIIRRGAYSEHESQEAG